MICFVYILFALTGFTKDAISSLLFLMGCASFLRESGLSLGGAHGLFFLSTTGACGVA